jgi:hypothetical protein
MKLLIMKFSPLPCYLSLRSKYSPQHPILIHPQSTFLPHCQRPCFTPIQNNTLPGNTAKGTFYMHRNEAQNNDEYN